MKKININLTDKYSIYIGKKLLQHNVLMKAFHKHINSVVIIADSKISDIYGNILLEFFRQQNLKVYLLPFIANERNKNRILKQQFEDKMLSLGCGRDSCIIALGGGITTDFAGFIAATYCRGIPAFYVPTTLLAMVDACVGGKTGVNTSFGKNLIGTFAQPQAVFIDIDTLETLPQNELQNGMVEMIKHALIQDAQYFYFLKKNIVAIKTLESKTLRKAIIASCKIKSYIVEQDEKDCGIRQLLNFGHTIGHALEKTTNFDLSHGQAVALGIIAESYISVQLGLLAKEAFSTIREIFEKIQIPIKLSENYKKETIKEALLFDKKTRNRQPYFVLLDKIGKAHRSNSNYIVPISNDIVNAGLSVICSS